ncbi:DsbA family protein (plasmid) [Rhodococcus opacus]|uniref:DsbA family oxidoreductase n=1 Tax=Rhodococcus opacus TaxID=37919 RepID=UPI0034D317B3
MDFWSDLGCPWASLAVHRFRAARAALGLDGQVQLRHRAFPLELINGRGTPKQTLDAEHEVLTKLQPDLGWRSWTIDESLYPGSMLLPLEAVRAAQFEDVGGLRASEDLDAALRRAFYAESRPIHLHTEILAVAKDCESIDPDALSRHLEAGTARAQIFEDLRRWRDAGVQGSPHLFFSDGSSAHNPGVAIEWHRDSGGDWHVEVVSDDPGVFAELISSMVAGSQR